MRGRHGGVTERLAWSGQPRLATRLRYSDRVHQNQQQALAARPPHPTCPPHHPPVACASERHESTMEGVMYSG